MSHNWFGLSIAAIEQQWRGGAKAKGVAYGKKLE
jgi:hypothetical protein